MYWCIAMAALLACPPVFFEMFFKLSFKGEQLCWIEKH
jgi:hypothetical protein